MKRDLFTESQQVAEAARPGGVSSHAPDAPAGASRARAFDEPEDRTSIAWFAWEQARLRAEGQRSADEFHAHQRAIKAAAQEGIDMAVAHANREAPGWSDVAFEFIRLHAMRNRGKRFTGYDVVQASIAYGVIQPVQPRAWGGPLQRAARAGLIVKVGSVPDQNPERHGSDVPLWEAA